MKRPLLSIILVFIFLNISNAEDSIFDYFKFKKACKQYIISKYPTLNVKFINPIYNFFHNEYFCIVKAHIEYDFDFSIWKEGDGLIDSMQNQYINTDIENKYKCFFTNNGIKIDSIFVRIKPDINYKDLNKIKYSGEKIDGFLIYINNNKMYKNEFTNLIYKFFIFNYSNGYNLCSLDEDPVYVIKNRNGSLFATEDHINPLYREYSKTSIVLNVHKGIVMVIK
jgi:hypothetical protein